MKSYTSRCLRVIAMAAIVGEYKANVKRFSWDAASAFLI
jgi:hypothetical protein